MHICRVDFPMFTRFYPVILRLSSELVFMVTYNLFALMDFDMTLFKEAKVISQIRKPHITIG